MVITHFLGSILSVTMLKLSTELSSSPLIEARALIIQNYKVRFMLSNILRLLFTFVMRLTLWYRLITNKYQSWDPIVCCCGYIKYIRCPWFEWFGYLILYFAYCAWAGFSGTKTWENKLHACYCLCAIKHIMW